MTVTKHRYFVKRRGLLGLAGLAQCLHLVPPSCCQRVLKLGRAPQCKATGEPVCPVCRCGLCPSSDKATGVTWAPPYQLSNPLTLVPSRDVQGCSQPKFPPSSHLPTGIAFQHMRPWGPLSLHPGRGTARMKRSREHVHSRLRRNTCV